MPTIPINDSNKSKLIEILTPETSVFSMFIPLTKISEELCPIPKGFVEDLARQAKFFHDKSMKYTFATDSQSMSTYQYQAVQEILGKIGVDVIDISTLPDYIPYNKEFSRCEEGTDAKTLYARTTQFSKAEYIDKTKVMLANLAGTPPWQNILVTDFDIFIDKPSLQVVEGEKMAFTFSGCHAKPSTIFDTENSMVFVSKERPQTVDGKDLLEYALFRIRKVLESEEHVPGKFGCFVFSTLCHDPIIAANMPKAREILIEAAKKIILERGQNQDEIEEQLIELEDNMPSQEELEHQLLHPSSIDDGSEMPRELLCHSATESGAHLIHGNYHSPNMETWKHGNMETWKHGNIQIVCTLALLSKQPNFLSSPA